MGSNKLLLELKGMTVLERTVSTILKTKNLESLVIVSSKDNLENYKSLLSRYSNIDFIVGGKTREESVFNGIEFLVNKINQENDYILVHDAARCLLSVEDLERVCSEVLVKKAISLATKVVDTLKKTDSSLKITESIDRDNAWQMQTPQVFNAKILIDAHFDNKDSNISSTCDASIVARNHDVFLCEAKKPNFKLTLESDLELFSKLVK